MSVFISPTVHRRFFIAVDRLANRAYKYNFLVNYLLSSLFNYELNYQFNAI